jgi:hypothetical protein
MPGQVPRVAVPVRPGDRVRLLLPHSEVCMHMGVAGRVMTVEVTTGEHPTAQLLNDDGSRFSFPILTAEAGILGSAGSLYCYGGSRRR